MAKDETLFTRRTEQEIDEALAWLENISSEDEQKPEQAARQKSKPSAYDVLPTWLKMDLHLEAPENPPVDAPKARNDNLSWLDSIATGLGGPLEEPPTMSWEETAIYQVSDEERRQALADAADVVEDQLEEQSIDVAMTGAAIAASQELQSSETTEIWLPTDESLESAIRNLEAPRRKEVASDFEGMEPEVFDGDALEKIQDVDAEASFLQAVEELAEPDQSYIPDSDTMMGILDSAAEDMQAHYDENYVPPIDIEDGQGTDFPSLTPPDLENFVDETLNPIEEDVTSVLEPEVELDAADLDFDLPFDEPAQEETQLLLAEDEEDSTPQDADVSAESTVRDDVDAIIARVENRQPELSDKFPILAATDPDGDDKDVDLEEVTQIFVPHDEADLPDHEAEDGITQIYLPDDEQDSSGYLEEVSADIAAERADFEQYVSDIESRTEAHQVVDSTEAVTQIFLPERDNAEHANAVDTTEEVTQIFLPPSAEAEVPTEAEGLTEIYLPDLLEQAAGRTRESLDVTEVHLPSPEEQESAYLDAVEADATEIYIQKDGGNETHQVPENGTPLYDDAIPAPVDFTVIDEVDASSQAVASELASEPTIISQLPISARWNSLLENTAAQLDGMEDVDEEPEIAEPASDARPVETTSIASEIPEDPDEAMAWLESMVRKQQIGEQVDAPSALQIGSDRVDNIMAGENAHASDLTEIYPPDEISDATLTQHAFSDSLNDVDLTAETQIAPAVDSSLVEDPDQFAVDDTSEIEFPVVDPLTDTDEIPNVTDEMLAELAELESSFDDADPLAVTQLSPAASVDQVSDLASLGLTEADVDDLEFPAIVNEIEAVKPALPMAESADDELNDALAWLKNIAEGSDTPLDEMTVELDQEDVAKLLEEHLARNSDPEAELSSSVVPEPEPVQNTDDLQAERVYEQTLEDSQFLADALNEADGVLNQSAPAQTYEDGPTLITEMPELEEGIHIDEPTQIEQFGDSGELDEALAWLEAFTNDEPSIQPKGNLAAEAYAGSFSDDTVAPAYESERMQAHKAFKERDFAAVARAYSAVLTQGDPLGADLVVRDVKEWVKTAADQPKLFSLLGEGHLQLKQFELSALAYRRALELS